MRSDCVLTDEQSSAARRRGEELARRAVAAYETADAFEIARRAGVEITFRRWPLVTVGECEPRTASVAVNLAALECAREGADGRLCAHTLAGLIIAHELGHFFDARWSPGSPMRGGSNGTSFNARALERLFSEQVAHSFAARLCNLPHAAEEYARLWRK